MGSAGPGQPASEDVFDASHPNPRIASELAGAALLDAGRQRLGDAPSAGARHGQAGPDHAHRRRSRARRASSAYIGDGRNRWPAAHVLDVARLYRLALEKGEAGARYHAVAEEGVPARDIAEVLGRGLERAGEVPVAGGGAGPFRLARHVRRHGLAGLERADAGSGSDWHPTGPGLIADLDAMDYAVERR